MNTLLQLFEDSAIERVFTKDERADISKYCLRYMFKLDSLTKFKDNLDEYGLRTELWRDNATRSSTVAKIKVWIRYISKHPKKKVGRKFDLKSVESELRDIFLSDEGLVKEIASIEGPTYTWDEMQKVLANAVIALAPHIKSRTSKKLRFLINDSGNDLEDFESELTINVIAAIYAKYPKFQSYDHLLNTGRKTVNNMSINIIKHYTTQSRATKYQNADGTFSSNKVSLDVIGPEGAFNQEGASADSALSTNKELEELETMTSLSKMLNSPKKVKAFKLLMDYDKSFSQWLVSSRRTTVTENNKFQDRLISKGKPDEYINCIADYLEIPQPTLHKFFGRLATGLDLGNYN